MRLSAVEIEKMENPGEFGIKLIPQQFSSVIPSCIYITSKDISLLRRTIILFKSDTS